MDDLGIEVLVFVYNRKKKTNFWCAVQALIDFGQFQFLSEYSLRTCFVYSSQAIVQKKTLNK